MPRIERSIEIAAPIERVFAFVTDIRNHRRVAPPQTREQLLDAGDSPMRAGTIVRMRARYGGVPWTLAAQITAFDPPDSSRPHSAYFRDEQIQGPFAVWKHDHWFASTPNGGTRLTDRFTYAAPMGPLGKLVERFWLNGRLRHLLEYMQTTGKRLLEEENCGQAGNQSA